jgi:hypothetical protein
MMHRPTNKPKEVTRNNTNGDPQVLTKVPRSVEEVEKVVGSAYK